MRTTLRQLPDHARRFGIRDAVAGWWLDLPWRRRPVRKLRVLLFEPGRGWLRWGWDVAWETIPILDDGSGPSEPFGVAPPLRRFLQAYIDAADIILRGGWPSEPPRRCRRLYATCVDPDWPWGYL